MILLVLISNVFRLNSYTIVSISAVMHTCDKCRSQFSWYRCSQTRNDNDSPGAFCNNTHAEVFRNWIHWNVRELGKVIISSQFGMTVAEKNDFVFPDLWMFRNDENTRKILPYETNPGKLKTYFALMFSSRTLAAH